MELHSGKYQEQISNILQQETFGFVLSNNYDKHPVNTNFSAIFI